MVSVQISLKLPSVFSDHMVLQRHAAIPVWGWAQPGANIHVTLGKTTMQGIADAEGNWKVHLPSQSASFTPRNLKKSPPTAATLRLGPIGDSATAWINGKKLESSTEAAPGSITLSVSQNTLKTGRNTIALRIFTPFAFGGFIGGDQYPYLEWPDFQLQLTGIWRRQTESIIASDEPLDKQVKVGAPTLPKDYRGYGRPASLANGMISPVTPYGLRGVIWYKGEADAGFRPQDYRGKMKALMEDWRRWFENQEMHFGIVQLANFLSPANPLKDDNWPHLREAQRLAVLDDPKAGLAVAIDAGETNDIHPRHKQVIGRRLARWALADVYQKIDLRGGPEPVEIRFEEATALIRFEQVGSGLKALNGNPLSGFLLAGEDRKFYEADATIESDVVKVTSESVSRPIAVHYAWHLNPIWANLGNEERLPAVPFKSDDWNMGESS
ncbi:MAG: hypothetical protein HRU10_12630 [Opitutales bacterium]|nr:hypothetical protein [Opitutales bacterium]